MHPTELSFTSANTGIELAFYWCVHARLTLGRNGGILLFFIHGNKLIHVILLEDRVHICILQVFSQTHSWVICSLQCVLHHGFLQNQTVSVCTKAILAQYLRHYGEDLNEG